LARDELRLGRRAIRSTVAARSRDGWTRRWQARYR
jgi:hypothetical protein